MGYFAVGLLGVESDIIKIEEARSAAAVSSSTLTLGRLLTPPELEDGNDDIAFRLARSASAVKNPKLAESYPSGGLPDA